MCENCRISKKEKICNCLCQERWMRTHKFFDECQACDHMVDRNE